MIYRLFLNSKCFQEVLDSTEDHGGKRYVISNRWVAVESPTGWYHMTGLGSPVEDLTIRQRFLDLFADFPAEMAFWLPPRQPADIGLLHDHSHFVVLSSALESKVPWLLERIAREGVLVDYPFDLSLKYIQNWFDCEDTPRTWPQLSKLREHPVEIVMHGTSFVVCDPAALQGYRIKLFCCTNWQHDLLDRQLSKGEDHTWEANGVKARYYKVGWPIVFKRMPPSGAWLFRIPEDTGSVYCTQDFKDAYDAHDLKGLIFQPVALSESYVPPPPPAPQPNRWEKERG